MTITKWIKFATVSGAALILAACGGSNQSEEAEAQLGGNDFDQTQNVHVISREDGSGTRGAFTEITGILAKDGDKETDLTYSGATIQNNTNAVMTSVAQDIAAIGYISMDSLNDSVKAVSIDDVSPSIETIQQKEYPISRPFNLAYKGELSEAAEDFWNYIMSKEGQQIIAEEGLVQVVQQAPAYQASEGLSGTISVVGSTSVTPVMEKLAEAYQTLQPNVQIDITSNGSSAGMTAAMDGTAEIGMSSRELTEEETSQLESEAIAIDGIAVIVHKDNPVQSLTTEQVKQIFTGELDTWEGLAP
ncbi:substrate-binding domain-containing protein [Pisciglobus halotolerans]|uniref:Phosphate ABC transporter substrate-binding protein, PhoT family n=1 Tax=Pisciglobus halotolerans TaxID=745365 RepID=A0A1I3BK99_9LACT|nr:substrate-binding domain-containing protein [Pisciglobus halotolerans]SFH62698.1 phosphate ABC transporter substrate-binding protein, PhoT family [Pisciglobus halotolerans]